MATWQPVALGLRMGRENRLRRIARTRHPPGRSKSRSCLPTIISAAGSDLETGWGAGPIESMFTKAGTLSPRWTLPRTRLCCMCGDWMWRQSQLHGRRWGARVGGGAYRFCGYGYHVAYDGSGNVTALMRSGGDTVAAAYEYGPFGENVRTEVLDEAVRNQPFRFSTKFTDHETNLVYYGQRFYDPSTGRFLNRDPIGEAGGTNLYAFVGNNPVNGIDVLGTNPITDFFGWLMGVFKGGDNSRPSIFDGPTSTVVPAGVETAMTGSDFEGFYDGDPANSAKGVHDTNVRNEVARIVQGKYAGRTPTQTAQVSRKLRTSTSAYRQPYTLGEGRAPRLRVASGHRPVRHRCRTRDRLLRPWDGPLEAENRVRLSLRAKSRDFQDNSRIRDREPRILIRPGGIPYKTTAGTC